MFSTALLGSSRKARAGSGLAPWNFVGTPDLLVGKVLRFWNQESDQKPRRPEKLCPAVKS